MENRIVKSNVGYKAIDHQPESSSRILFESLPEEIIVKILSNLHCSEDICAAACLNKRLNRLTVFSVGRLVNKTLLSCVMIFDRCFAENEQVNNDNLSVSDLWVDMIDHLNACNSLNQVKHYRTQASKVLAEHFKDKIKKTGLKNILSLLLNRDDPGVVLRNQLQRVLYIVAILGIFDNIEGCNNSDHPKYFHEIISSLIQLDEVELAKEMVYKFTELNMEDFRMGWDQGLNPIMEEMDEGLRARSSVFFDTILELLKGSAGPLFAAEFIRTLSNEDMSESTKSSCLIEIDDHLYDYSKRPTTNMDEQLDQASAISYISDSGKFAYAAKQYILRKAPHSAKVLKSLPQHYAFMSEDDRLEFIFEIYRACLCAKQFEETSNIMELAHEDLNPSNTMQRDIIQSWSTFLLHAADVSTKLDYSGVELPRVNTVTHGRGLLHTPIYTLFDRRTF